MLATAILYWSIILTLISSPYHICVTPYTILIPVHVPRSTLQFFLRSRLNIKAAYPADASYGRWFHWVAIREHSVIVTAKQMHLFSDQNNRQTTFPVRRSAPGLSTSRHYSRHNRLTRHALVYCTATTQHGGSVSSGLSILSHKFSQAPVDMSSLDPKPDRLPPQTCPPQWGRSA